MIHVELKEIYTVETAIIVSNPNYSQLGTVRREHLMGYVGCEGKIRKIIIIFIPVFLLLVPVFKILYREGIQRSN